MYSRDNLVTIDCETYINYFLIGFKHLNTGKVLRVELRGIDAELNKQQRKQVHRAMSKCVSFGFNSNRYDIPMILLAMRGYTCHQLKAASDHIIFSNAPDWMTCRYYDIQRPTKWRTFDIIEPAPAVKVGLKLYGGRLHSRRLQDLPYAHDSVLTPTQMDDVADYNTNDLDTNIDLYNNIVPRIDLRAKLSDEYRIDMMSKSDAQMAEAIFKYDLNKVGILAKRPAEKPADFKMRYEIPNYIKFHNLELNALAAKIEAEDFVLGKGAKITLPLWLRQTPITIGQSTYKIGLGGLHSQEKHTHHIPSAGWILADRDVASYYPRIILSLGLYPPHLTNAFLSVYNDIVERRLRAKASGDKITDAGLKISINGSFGKLGSKYSLLYSPNQLLAVTLTGQMALLMLIERLEYHGISVVSANTDGFVSMIPDHLYELYDDVCFEWELDTGFSLEETQYRALYSRDVNNYLAVKPDGSTKGKGIFADPSAMKNPVSNVCVDAVKAYLLHGTPIHETIHQCRDIKKFVNVRTVAGGGVWKDQYLGKVVRWVYSTVGEAIHYQKNGNKVATSDGALPVMDLPDKLPVTLDHNKYIEMTEKIVREVGCS